MYKKLISDLRAGKAFTLKNDYLPENPYYYKLLNFHNESFLGETFEVYKSTRNSLSNIPLTFVHDIQGHSLTRTSFLVYTSVMGRSKRFKIKLSDVVIFELDTTDISQLSLFHL